jgi:hypothetical protein
MDSTNLGTYHSPSRYRSPIRNQNLNSNINTRNDYNYNSYEQKLFNDLLKKLMQVESEIERIKIDLACNPEFNCEDAFRLFELEGRGFLDKEDLKYGLNLLDINPSDQEVRLLMKRFDLKNQGGDGVTDNAVDRFCRREYGETFAEFLDKRKSMLETQLLNKAYTMIGTNSAVTIFFLKNVLGWTDKVEQTQTIKGDVPLVQVYLPDNGRDKT